jgi:hypothetical protein
MHLFTTFLAAVVLAASAFAAPHAFTPGEFSARAAAPEFLSGTQTGQGESTALIAFRIPTRAALIQALGTVLVSARAA